MSLYDDCLTDEMIWRYEMGYVTKDEMFDWFMEHSDATEDSYEKAIAEAEHKTRQQGKLVAEALPGVKANFEEVRKIMQEVDRVLPKIRDQLDTLAECVKEY